VATVVVIAADRAQATVFVYIAGLLDAVPSAGSRHDAGVARRH
jgi:hypothetical protein